MAFTPRAGRAVISLGVDGAASSKKDIDSVGASLKKLNDSSFQKLSGQVSAIQSHIGGLKSTISDLAQLTVAGVGAGAFIGMIQGSIDAADNLNDLSKTTGITLANLSGLKLAAQQSGGDLEGIADSINKLSVAMGKDAERFAKLGVTAKDPLEAFEQLADVFTAIDDPQTRAALGAAALGKSWSSAAPLLSEGGDKIRQLVARGTELSGMTQEIGDRADAFNDKMAEMGAAVEGAKNKIASDLLPALTQIATAMTDAYVESGLFSAALIGIGGAMAHAFTDEFASAEVKLRNLKGELDVLKNYQLNAKEAVPVLGWLLWGSEEAWDQEIASKQKDIDSLMASTASAKATAQAKAAADRKAAEDKAAEDKKKAEDAAAFLKGEAAAKAAAAAVLRQQEAYTALTSSIKGRIAETERELAGLAPLNEAEKLHADLTERLLTGKLKLSPAEKAAQKQRIAELDVNLKLIEAQKITNRFREHAKKLLGDRQEAAKKTIGDAVEEAEKNEDLARTFGMTASAIAELEVARLEGQRAQYSSIAVTEKEIAAVETLEQLISAKKRSAAAIGLREGLEAGKRANDEMISDSKRMSDSIEHNLSDALMRGFESGKGLLANLRDTAKNMFKTLVLQPTISGIMAPISGALAGAFMPSMAGAATTATASGVGSAVGTGLGFGGAFGAIGTGAMQTAGAILSGQIGLGSTLSAGLSAIGTGSASGIMAGLSSVVGALGPIALGIGAAVAIWKKLDTSGTMHTGGASRATADGVYTVRPESLNFQGTVASKATEEMTAGLASGIVKILDSTATAFGKTAGYSAATAFADDTSKDGAWGALVIEKMGKAVVDWQDTRTSRWAPKEFADGAAGQTQYLAALSGSVRTALNDIGLPSWAKTMLDGLGDAPAIEELAKVVDAINATQRALTVMGDKLAGFAGLSESSTSSLIKAAGGIDALASGVSSYYDNFYSESEKSAAALSEIKAALAAVGLEMPTTRAGLRAQAEAQLALGEAGAPAAAVVFKVAAAFARLHPELEATVATLSGKDLVAAFDNAERAYRDAIGNVSDVVRGLYDRVLDTQQGIVDAQNNISQAYFNAQDEKAAAEARIIDLQRQATAETIAFGSSIHDFLTSLNTSALGSRSSADQLTSLKAQFSATAVLAQGGDKGARDSLLGTAKDLLNAQRNASGSRAEFAMAEAQIKAALGGIADISAAKAAGGPSAIDPMLEAQNKLVIAENRLLEYAALASITGASTDRSSQVTADSTSALLAAFNNATAESNVARGDYQTALELTSNLALTSTNNLSALGEALIKVAQTQIDVIKARDDLVKYADEVGLSTGKLEETITIMRAQFGSTVLSAQTLGSSLGLLGGSVQTLMGILNSVSYTPPSLPGMPGRGGSPSELSAEQQAVSKMYNDVLGRVPDAAGLNFWADAISDGVLKMSDAARTIALSAANMDPAAQHAAGWTLEKALSDQTAGKDWLHQMGVPGFASGGEFGGGLRIVGENGPELEATGPSRIWNASQTRSMLGGGGTNNAELLAEMRAMRAEIASLRAAADRTASNTGATASSSARVKDAIEAVVYGDESLQTREVTA